VLGKKVILYEWFILTLFQDAADIIVHRMGGHKDNYTVSSVDMKDAKLGETVTYEFDLEIGGGIYPFIIREEISDLRFLEDVFPGDSEGSREAVWQPQFVSANLDPFQLTGPVDLWIQDPDNLRLAMPVCFSCWNSYQA
jgi:hypothetical protein